MAFSLYFFAFIVVILSASALETSGIGPGGKNSNPIKIYINRQYPFLKIMGEGDILRYKIYHNSPGLLTNSHLKFFLLDYSIGSLNFDKRHCVETLQLIPKPFMINAVTCCILPLIDCYLRFWSRFISQKRSEQCAICSRNTSKLRVEFSTIFFPD